MDYQVMPPLSEDEYTELKADIRNRGVMVPIEFDEDGNVLDGHHRLKACEELGITDYPKIVRSGMTEEQKRTHARKLNMARRQLNREQKQQLIREQLRETPERSDRQIAGELGVSNPTVSATRKKMEEAGQLLKINSSIGADGKERPRQFGRKQSQREYTTEEIVADIEQDGLQYTVQNDDGTYSIFDKETGEYCTTIGELQKPKKPHVINNSGDNEWYTPSEYIEAARSVMGSIDLDPASNDYANKTVKAWRYFTKQTNGLEQEWFGNIWMNPPYSTELIKLFADKLADSLFDQAIILVNNATDTAWFKTLISKASAVVFTTGRIRFQKRDGAKGAPLQGQAFIYCGDNPRKFLEVFKQFGWGARL